MNAESEIHKIANEKEQKRSKVPQSNIVYTLKIIKFIIFLFYNKNRILIFL